jgi:uncharacterized protein involved in response to NO
MAVPRTRPGHYPAVLSYGFRPFFLLGAVYAGFGILVWLPLFYGRLETASLFAPVDWHIHEMLFGYLTAVVTGFLLTAIPNWTGRLPVQGLPLFVLVARCGWRGASPCSSPRRSAGRPLRRWIAPSFWSWPSLRAWRSSPGTTGGT